MFTKKTLVLGVVYIAFAALLPINYVHARLSSKYKEWHTSKLEPPKDGTGAQIVFRVQGSDESNSNKNIKLNEVQSDDNIMTVTSDDNPNNFLHEDYLYAFHPSPNSEQQWQIQRIPNPNRNRKLQEGGAEINNADVIDNTANSEEKSGDENNKSNKEEYISRITSALLSLFCVMLAALAAGLTMGMLSLDPLFLEIKRRSSTDPIERQWSSELLPLLVGHSKRHRLLCSLLLMNSIANEALPLFLDELFPSKLASIGVSVTLVLLFGEIVPSALFTGPNQVELAAKLVPLVKTVMFVLAPIAVPIANVLDWVLPDDSGSGGGEHKNDSSDVEQDVTEGNYYNRTELSALVRIQYESQLADKRRRKNEQKLLLKKPVTGLDPRRSSVFVNSSNDASSSHVSASSRTSAISGSQQDPHNRHGHHSIRSISRDLTASNRTTDGHSELTRRRMPSIHQDEITMIEGALAMTTKVAADIYTPIRRMYALPSDTILDEDTMVEIWARGFSRVPVYCPKPCVSLDDDACPSDFVDVSGIVGVLMVRQLIVVNPEDNRPIETLPLAVPSCIPPSMHLVDLINHFQAGGGRGKGGLHLALVCARPTLATEALERGECIPKDAGVVGVITLEDVVEELLQEEIYDESDRDLELAQWGVNKWKRFVKSKRAQKGETTTTEATPLLA
mmetsp:Transcript_24858/g.52046  ORF Transcript_24858/g.52046 Transcript_24858/m.52046 type:complete len:676 (+) Transcript_24858:122-2149(+)